MDYIFIRSLNGDEMPISVRDLKKHPEMVLAAIDILEKIDRERTHPEHRYITEEDAIHDINRVPKIIQKAHALGYIYVINPRWLIAKYGIHRTVVELVPAKLVS